MTSQPLAELAIALARLDPTLGDVASNLAKARQARADAARRGAVTAGGGQREVAQDRLNGSRAALRFHSGCAASGSFPLATIASSSLARFLRASPMQLLTSAKTTGSPWMRSMQSLRSPSHLT